MGNIKCIELTKDNYEFYLDKVEELEQLVAERMAQEGRIGQFFTTGKEGIEEYILSENNKGSKYDLIGVINHYGGESFGHYTAYCLNGDKWIEYNDESLSQIREKNVISSAAYVLFYKRRNYS